MKALVKLGKEAFVLWRGLHVSGAVHWLVGILTMTGIPL